MNTRKLLEQLKCRKAKIIMRVSLLIACVGMIIGAFTLGGRVQKEQIYFDQTLEKLNKECVILHELKKKEMPEEMFWVVENMKIELFQLMSYPEGFISKIFFDEQKNKENFATVAEDVLRVYTEIIDSTYWPYSKNTEKVEQ
ncbi:hypothetical protein [Enterococcus sp. AZ129]|uniref:hypothetical protein n=1 Tax=unclassified Enterococcus TaxID=2608891 RepID=UPI003F21FD78